MARGGDLFRIAARRMVDVNRERWLPRVGHDVEVARAVGFGADRAAGCIGGYCGSAY
jgi:hypothetical protein